MPKCQPGNITYSRGVKFTSKVNSIRRLYRGALSPQTEIQSGQHPILRDPRNAHTPCGHRRSISPGQSERLACRGTPVVYSMINVFFFGTFKNLVYLAQHFLDGDMHDLGIRNIVACVYS